MLNALAKIRTLLTRLEEIFLVLILAVLVFFSFLQVVFRLFLHATFWTDADIFLRHLVLWVGFLGAALAVSNNSHFSVDILKKNLPAFPQKCAEISSDLFAAAVLYFLGTAAHRFFMDERAQPSVLFTAGKWEVLSYQMDIILPLGFFLLLLHFVLKIIEDLLAFRPRP